MASRKTRRSSRLDSRGALAAPRFFRAMPVSGSLAGRAPWRSRSLDLPRPVPLGFNVIQSLGRRPLDDVLRPRRGRIAPTLVVQPGRGRSALPGRLKVRYPHLAKPLLATRHTVCDTRRSRREVMFSLRVAGKRWSSGRGPSMNNARRSVSSNYSCR